MYNNPLQEALQKLNNMGKATKPSSISEPKKKINEDLVDDAMEKFKKSKDWKNSLSLPELWSVYLFADYYKNIDIDKKEVKNYIFNGFDQIQESLSKICGESVQIKYYFVRNSEYNLNIEISKIENVDSDWIAISFTPTSISPVDGQDAGRRNFDYFVDRNYLAKSLDTQIPYNCFVDEKAMTFSQVIDYFKSTSADVLVNQLQQYFKKKNSFTDSHTSYII